MTAISQLAQLSVGVRKSIARRAPSSPKDLDTSTRSIASNAKEELRFSPICPALEEEEEEEEKVWLVPEGNVFTITGITNEPADVTKLVAVVEKGKEGLGIPPAMTKPIELSW